MVVVLVLLLAINLSHAGRSDLTGEVNVIDSYTLITAGFLGATRDSKSCTGQRRISVNR